MGNISFQFITYYIDYRGQCFNWYTHTSLRPLRRPALQNVLECGVLWLASLSPSCPAWRSITAALPLLPEHIFHHQSSCQTSISAHWIRGRKQRRPLVTLKLSPCVGLSLAVVGGTEEVETPRSRRDSKSLSVCGTIDRTADRRSKGVINLLFKSKVRLSGVPRQAVSRQVSAFNSLKVLKGLFYVGVFLFVFWWFKHHDFYYYTYFNRAPKQRIWSPVIRPKTTQIISKMP